MTTNINIRGSSNGSYAPVTGLSYTDSGLSAAAVQPILNVPVVSQGNAFVTWTTMPAAATIFLGSSRWNQVTKMDLTNYSQARISFIVGTAGASGSKLVARYATSVGTPPLVGDFAAELGTSEISGVLTVGSTLVTSSWINLAAGAKADVYLCTIGLDGDAATSPTIGNLQMQFR